VLFFNNQFLTLTTVFSQGDDNKKGGGFGIQERERDRIRIHAENNSQIVNADRFGIQEKERSRIHAENNSQIVNADRFGIQEKERSRIHAENNSQIINTDLTSIILIATIIVIIGVSSYALYKIYLIKRKSNQSKPKK
jgi:hypothetical protein